VQAAQRAGTVAIGWTAADCRIPGEALGPAAGQATAGGLPATRVYLGADGVKVPLVTDAERQARRHKAKQKRRRRGRECRPLPRAKRGADQRYQGFKVVTSYGEGQGHRHVSVTAGDHRAAGVLLRRDAARIALGRADGKGAAIGGAEWIRQQRARQNLPPGAVGLDFYHPAENVHKARRAVYGGRRPRGRRGRRGCCTPPSTTGTRRCGARWSRGGGGCGASGSGGRRGGCWVR